MPPPGGLVFHPHAPTATLGALGWGVQSKLLRGTADPNLMFTRRRPAEISQDGEGSGTQSRLIPIVVTQR